MRDLAVQRAAGENFTNIPDLAFQGLVKVGICYYKETENVVWPSSYLRVGYRSLCQRLGVSPYVSARQPLPKYIVLH